MKRVMPIEIYDVFLASAGDLQTAQAAGGHSSAGIDASPEARFTALRTLADCDACGEALVSRLSRQSGHNVRRIIRAGGRVYALVDGDAVLTQLTVDLRAPVAVETPVPLFIKLPPAAGFLSYLYTYPAWRGRGLAQRLIRHVVRGLSEEGTSHFVSHVSATNISSQNAFLASGWRRAGLLVTDRRRRILYQGGLSRHGIAIDPA